MKNNSHLRLCILTILGISLSVPLTTYAETISVTGDYGLNGAAGISGEPGTAGESGTGGGSVTITANQLSDSENRATASGGTGGRGGSGGRGLNGAPGGDGGNGGNGGDASANAYSTVTTGTGQARAIADANGGNGGQSGGAGTTNEPTLYGQDGNSGSGGNAYAEATATGVNSVYVQARADGGNGAVLSSSYGVGIRAGDGGAANLGVVYAESTNGGYTDVRGTAVGGDGGSDNASGNGGFASAGNGSSTTLLNAVDGNTTGQLRLEQNAVGGDAGAAIGGSTGLAGNASSSLTKETSSSNLILDVRATGGVGSYSRYVPAGTGGAAYSSASGRNNTGEVNIDSVADAGHGGLGGSNAHGGDGANATSNAFGETVLDGQRVDVRATAYASAGGTAGNGRFGGNGGDAVSRSEGRALGNSVVNVRDRADGGHGGSVSGSSDTLVGLGGQGGHASSTAIGSSNGGYIDVRSVAYSGTGGSAGTGNTQGIAGVGGNATSVSQGVTQGTIYAESVANSHYAGRDIQSGNARASSLATGSDGRSRANASAENRLMHNAVASTEATVAGNASNGIAATSRAEAAISFGQANYTVAEAETGHAVAMATISPDNEAMDVFVAGHSNVQAHLGYGNGDSIFTGILGAAYSDGGAQDSLESYSAALDFTIDTLEFNSQENLLFGFYNLDGFGTGFDSLDFQVQVEGSIFVDETFADLESALNYFNDNTLDLGYWSDYINGTDLSFRVQLALEADSIGEGFGVGMGLSNATMSAVPVPAAAWLFGSGLIGLIGIAKRKTRT